METIDYYATMLMKNGLDHIPIGYYYSEGFMDDPKTIGK